VSLVHDSSMTKTWVLTNPPTGCWPIFTGRILVLALIFLSGMALEKQVEAHIKVSKYRFPYLVLGSGTIQSTMPVLKDDSKTGTGRSGATHMF
jgi:hypothetical protein